MSETLPRGARLVLLSCLVCQLGLGCSYVFGATLKNIVSEFEWSRTAYAASSLPLLLGYALAAPLVGLATERIGVRRVLSGAVLLLGATFWLFAHMQSLWAFYGISFLLGVSLTGVGDIPVGAIASRWVERGRGLALGLIYSGSNLGGAAVPVLAVALAARSSWRDALVWIGVLAVVTILPFAALGVREPPRGHRPRPAAPGARAAPPREPRPELGLGEALRTRTFWILAFVLFTFYLYFIAVNQHLIAYLSDLGYSDERAALGFGLAVGLGIASKLGVGALADRLSTRVALRLDFALLTTASVLLLFAESPLLLPVFLVAHGLATAAENVVLPLVVAECFGVRHLARIYGALMVTLLPGGALGPIFAGAVFDATGGYAPAFAVFALANACGLLALLAVRVEGVAPRSGLGSPAGVIG